MNKVFFLLVVITGLLFQSCVSVINFTDPNGPEYLGSYAVESYVTTSDIKVVTYNIAWGKRAEQAAGELSTIPALQNADVILLQEMDAAGVEKMAQSLGYNYAYFPGSIHNLTEKDIGNAILSRWSLTETKKLIFPHKQSWNDRIRLAVVATVHIAGKNVRVYDVHIATVMMSEKKQFDQLESVLADVSSDYDAVIVGGDFNTALPGSVERVQSLFESVGFFHASDGAGFTAKAFGLIPFTLDHIYIKGMNVLQSGVVKHAEASDHLPLWAVLEFDQE